MRTENHLNSIRVELVFKLLGYMYVLFYSLKRLVSNDIAVFISYGRTKIK